MLLRSGLLINSSLSGQRVCPTRKRWQQHDTDNNKAVDLVYLDFQKAFDKVPHERLMVKVNAHGIQGDAARWSSPTGMQQPIL